VHDGIQLERLGIPTGVVVTEPFVGAGRAMASLEGMPGYRFVTLPHPTAELHGAAVQDAARRIAAQLEALIVGPSGGS
jgi:hypothetical protein